MIYFCAQRNRRTTVLASSALNGIDYLEVADDNQTVLLLTLLRPLTPLLAPAQIAIVGGESITGIGVHSVDATGAATTLRIKVDRAGDFSTYTLRLRADETTDEPPPGFDPALAQIDFSFKAGCPVTGDCQQTTCCPVSAPVEPDINYLAKDYPGFVQIMVDRMAVLAPGWTERHAADLGVSLVEVLAYVADHLSYRQDAVATEAYLGTARSRISLRRHARLVDYRLDEGENARVWIYLPVNAIGVTLPAGTLVLPRVAGLVSHLDPNGAPARDLLARGGVVFATLADAKLSQTLNEINFYTWSDEECCLAAGATSATLSGHLDVLDGLSAGSVLLFEEMVGPKTGAHEDADRTHRCAARLTRVRATDRLGNVLTDPLTGEKITEIEWQEADALPFALCISSSITDSVGKPRQIENVSVARGNLVPADHGLLGEWEPLGIVPAPPAAPISGAGCCAPTLASVATTPFYYPELKRAPLTFARPFGPAIPASALGQTAPDAIPPTPAIEVLDDQNRAWTPHTGLLEFNPLQRGFAVEIERDGTAFLRFGDGEHGAAPVKDEGFRARYRIGNGTAGNVGADTLGHVLSTDARITGVRNPLPAAGGRDPETMEVTRQLAPWRFRTQLRAVTETDYGDAAAREPSIRAARGTLRWTGSWRTAFVTIDPAPRSPAPAKLAAATADRLDLLRMAGVDLATEAAFIVGLRIALSVCVAPRYVRAEVEGALRRVFTAGRTCDGTLGLLDPSNFSFGQTLYLSPFIAAAQAVEGVASVGASAFQRVDDPARDATAAGFITLQRLEIARIDNDPSRPDRGIFELALDGGQ